MVLAERSRSLLFMVPLPWTLERTLAHPLGTAATISSNRADANNRAPFGSGGASLQLRQTPLLIAEACSGLSMLVIFVAVATAMAILVRRPMSKRSW